MNPEDADCRKIANIYNEFMIEMVSNVMKIMHALILQVLRGLNFNFFTNFVIAQSGWKSIQKLCTDIQNFSTFRRFLINLDKDFPKIAYVLPNDPPSPDMNNDNWIVKQCTTRDHCAICQDIMMTARQLQCGHHFHQLCII